jgi:hypothetical protein
MCLVKDMLHFRQRWFCQDMWLRHLTILCSTTTTQHVAKSVPSAMRCVLPTFSSHSSIQLWSRTCYKHCQLGLTWIQNQVLMGENLPVATSHLNHDGMYCSVPYDRDVSLTETKL